MFGNNIDMKKDINNMKSQIRSLENRYWELFRKHGLLLEHLGLHETEIPASTELRKKGGPEQ